MEAFDRPNRSLIEVPPALIVGVAPQLVYSAEHEGCAASDYPDVALRAFRDSHGQIVAIASNAQNRSFVGESFDGIKHSCTTILTMSRNDDPAAMSWNSYLSATWTNDGTTVIGLVHNEYLANRIPGRCRYASVSQCWYNVVVQVKSLDGGKTFRPYAPPALVAGVPIKDSEEQGRHRGFFNPTNIVQYRDAQYFMSATTGGGSQKAGLCLFRTTNPLDPTAWRGLTKTGYRSMAIDPYRADPAKYIPCTPVKMGGTPNSISYVTRYKKFVAVMPLRIGSDAVTGGVQYAWSDDLVHWSAPLALLKIPMHGSRRCSDEFRYSYPSLIDPESKSRNFDTIDETAYLYMTRTKIVDCKSTRFRDLVRFQVRFN
jgi:hypothetical protein